MTGQTLGSSAKQEVPPQTKLKVRTVRVERTVKWDYAATYRDGQKRAGPRLRDVLRSGSITISKKS